MNFGFSPDVGVLAERRLGQVVFLAGWVRASLWWATDVAALRDSSKITFHSETDYLGSETNN